MYVTRFYYGIERECRILIKGLMMNFWNYKSNKRCKIELSQLHTLAKPRYLKLFRNLSTM